MRDKQEEVRKALDRLGWQAHPGDSEAALADLWDAAWEEGSREGYNDGWEDGYGSGAGW